MQLEASDMMNDRKAVGNKAGLEAIDAFVDDLLGRDGSLQRMQKLMESVRLELTQARDPLDRAIARARLMRAAGRPVDGEGARAARAMAAELAAEEVRGKRSLTCCANEDVANVYAAVGPAKRAKTSAALMRSVIENGLDVDANAILGPLDGNEAAEVLSDMERYAGGEKDHFKCFRAGMILFGALHQDPPGEGGTRYIRCAVEPDEERAREHFGRAQAAYVEGISLRLNEALKAGGLHFPTGLKDYRLKIPDVFLKKTLTLRTGLRVELDSCVGNDHVLISQEIGAQVLHMSIMIKDAETGEYDYPISVTVRRLDDPVLRLKSIDKKSGTVEVSTTGGLFDLEARGSNEWVRLSKASVISAGIVPYACRNEPPDTPIAPYLKKLGGGLDITTHVKGIPVGSGMGTSSAIAAVIVAALVKITGQAKSAPDGMRDEDKMYVVARVLLVEQLIGALGGWQDACAIFPGLKILETGPGEFLPKWRPLKISMDVRSRVIHGMKLTDGAYRQPSHAAAWQFAGLWAMRLAPVYEARMLSRALVKEQIKNLEHGRVSAMGAVESEDWKNRCVISPRATNPYIERVIELMRKVPGFENTGFDACGARGGAGGCWWIDTAKINDVIFERIFVKKSKEAMAEFKDRIRFEGEPRVYDYKMNEKGVVVELT